MSKQDLQWLVEGGNNRRASTQEGLTHTTRKTLRAAYHYYQQARDECYYSWALAEDNLEGDHNDSTLRRTEHERRHDYQIAEHQLIAAEYLLEIIEANEQIHLIGRYVTGEDEHLHPTYPQKGS